MSKSHGGGNFPPEFDGRRKRPKPIDAVQEDGMTMREKKLLQFRDQMLRRRKLVNNGSRFYNSQ